MYYEGPQSVVLDTGTLSSLFYFSNMQCLSAIRFKNKSLNKCLYTNIIIILKTTPFEARRFVYSYFFFSAHRIYKFADNDVHYISNACM